MLPWPIERAAAVHAKTRDIYIEFYKLPCVMFTSYDFGVLGKVSLINGDPDGEICELFPTEGSKDTEKASTSGDYMFGLIFSVN